MFNLINIKISNFRSYRGEHVFEFPTVSGLYFLTGKNLAEPSLGSNGSGKSTLLDAIVWCLYGRTMRGLKSNEIVSWGGSGCSVTLDLTVGDNDLTIKRTHKPISLSINGDPVDQTELEKHIRLNYDSFLHSVIDAQFGQPFLSLLPSAKLDLFSDILNLNYWLEQSDKTAELAKATDGQLTTLQSTLDRQEGQIAALQQDIKTLKENAEQFDTVQDELIKQLDDAHHAALDEVKEARLRIAGLESEKRTATKELNLINKAISQITPEKLKIQDEMAKLQKQEAELGREFERIEKQLRGLDELTTDCPTCLQEVRSTYLANEKGTLTVRQGVIKTTLRDLEKQLQPLNKNLVRVQAGLDQETAQTEELWNAISAIDLKLAREPVKLQMAQDKVAGLKQQIDKALKEANPHIGMLLNKRAQLKKLRASIEEITAEKHALDAKHEALKFWVKGFKRIRLFIIEQAFQTLEVEVNNCLAQLGMPDWQISFDVERENKSGGITKGFVVFVQSPANTGPVRWENWSGGEIQRLELAGTLGLANLIMQANGLQNTIEFYDEPSTHLSPEGMVDLANLLHDRAHSEGKVIFIVDHAAITNFGGFEGTIEVRKDSNGSSITTGG